MSKVWLWIMIVTHQPRQLHDLFKAYRNVFFFQILYFVFCTSTHIVKIFASLYVLFNESNVKKREEESKKKKMKPNQK